MMRTQLFTRAAIASAVLILAGVRLEAQGPAGTAPNATPPWDAKCVAVKVPEMVLTDQVFTGEITVKNTGSAPWASIPYAGEPNPQPILYCQDPNRNKTWGTDFAYVGQGKEIGPGKELPSSPASRPRVFPASTASSGGWPGGQRTARGSSSANRRSAR